MTAFASILTNPFSTQDIEDEPIETPRREEKALTVEIDLDVYGQDPDAYRAAYNARSRNRIEKMLVGCFPPELFSDGAGETDQERSVRIQYASPCPSPDDFMRRLRSVNPVFSVLKTRCCSSCPRNDFY